MTTRQPTLQDIAAAEDRVRHPQTETVHRLRFPGRTLCGFTGSLDHVSLGADVADDECCDECFPEGVE